MDYAKILYSEIPFRPAKTLLTNNSAPGSSAWNGGPTTTGNEEFQTPKQQLCDPNLVKLDWLQSEKVGGGLINVGNTCFLNSVLQCLTYCPPLYNFLVKLNGGHSSSCKINQFCMLCEMERHVKRIKSSNGSAIKPISIVQRLKYINKSFQFGRQEDAHEFLRYIIDHMWKACLTNLDINSKTNKIDSRIKETTVINHIFGGYHRSQVLCLTCNSRSNTFDFFMDFILDIRNAKSLEEALKKFTQAETLENENAYKCSKCRKKVTARKRFTVYRAPNVATFQLKRFDSDRIFGGKVTKFITYPEELDLRPYMSDPTKSPIKYQLSSVLVHVGHSSNSGHYFCFIKNSNNFWYRMDDSNVSLVTQTTVLQQQAYVLFYTRKTSDLNLKRPSNGIGQESSHPIVFNAANNSTTTTTSNNVNTSTSIPTSSPKSLDAQSKVSKQLNGNHKITNYFSSASKNNNTVNINNNINSSSNHNKNSQPQNLIAKESGANTNGSISSFTTWLGARSKLDEEAFNNNLKRKSIEMTERDKFNEELDQGKTKKIKSRNREDRFSNLSKTNPFQRFTSNGYQQYKTFQKHNGRHCHLKPNNFRRHQDPHKSNGKLKGRNNNFNRRQ